jgi:hypothetical protein
VSIAPAILRTGEAVPQVAIPVDAHAHYHPVFEPRRFLDAALTNMRPAARGGKGIAGVLLLAEPHPDRDPLRAWRNSSPEGWRLEQTGEAMSVVARREEEMLVLVAGRQLVSTEGLEVLALATDAKFLIQRPLRELVEQVRVAGGVPVVPWGFGKWWGRRGRVLMELLGRAGDDPLFMGDSGCRPAGAREHAAFRAARQSGVPVLAGTDPLPLAGQVRRIGAFGVVMPALLEGARPGAQIGGFLRALGQTPEFYGRRDSALSFMVSQVSLRLVRTR